MSWNRVISKNILRSKEFIFNIKGNKGSFLGIFNNDIINSDNIGKLKNEDIITVLLNDEKIKLVITNIIVRDHTVGALDNSYYEIHVEKYRFSPWKLFKNISELVAELYGAFCKKYFS